MTLFAIIVTVGVIYAACMYDPELLWVIGVACVAQFIRNLLKTEPELSQKQTQDRLVYNDFFKGMRYSPWSKYFSINEAKEKLQQTTNEMVIKALYHEILDDLEIEDDKTYCNNMHYVLIEIRQEIANRQIEAYRHGKPKGDTNYAQNYAASLGVSLTSSELTDEEALKNAGQCSTADLVYVILDVPEQISNTTAELTTGREEEMEGYYHNNLRKIEYLLRLELAKRFLES